MANEQTFPGSGYNIQLSDLLARQLFGERTLAAPTHNRIPFIFTSDYNLYQAMGSQGVAMGDATQALNNQLVGDQSVVIPQQTPNVRDSISVWPGFNNISQDRGRPAEIPPDNGAMIAMAVNPQSIKWDQPKRFTKKETQTGALFLFFSDNAGENNDILTLDISGTSGNIDTRGLNDPSSPIAEHAVQNSQKLLSWHRLYNLSRQPMFYTDNAGVTYQNNFYIIYRTVLIPFELRFIGFFSKVLDFTENATDPFKRDFNMQFTVTSTDPPLGDLVRFATSSIPGPTLPNTPGAVTATTGEYPASPYPVEDNTGP